MGLGRRANLLNVALLSALVLLLALPAGAFAASTVAIDGTVVRVTGDGADNVITLNLAGGTYTVSDTTGVTAGAGCAPGAPGSVTCPAAGIEEAIVDAGDGTDIVDGSSGPDTINGGASADTLRGGEGADDINGGAGNDVTDSGRGGIDPDFCADTPPFRCSESLDGGAGFDTITYATRTGRIEVDLRATHLLALDDDGTVDGVTGYRTEKIIGGQAADEMIGGLGVDNFNGGPGNAPDVICGGLGRDTVDYSDKDLGVTVDLGRCDPVP